MEKSLISDIPVNTLVNEDFNLDESMLRLYNAVLCWLQKNPKKPQNQRTFYPLQITTAEEVFQRQEMPVGLCVQIVVLAQLLKAFPFHTQPE